MPRAVRGGLIIALLLLVIAAAAGCATSHDASAAVDHAGPLTGTWVGALTGSSARAEHMVIVVNTAESAGTWRLSATCHGRLSLESISNGYHHYRRRVSTGSTCAGGDVDCLMRVGAEVYDTVTPHPGAPAVSGTLKRA